MKKLLYILPLFLLLSGCGKKEKLPTDPCSFEIKVDKVGGTKVWITVTPDNPNAYYALGMVSSHDPSYDDSPANQAATMLHWMNETYNNRAATSTNIGSFADVYLYQGTRDLKETMLAKDTGHKLIVMQVDPERRSLIGESAMVIFHTRPVPAADLEFELVFGADQVEIIPSDDTLPYYWDYENTITIDQEYYFPYNFFYSLADMYEEYDFMGNMIDQGPTEWIFSKEDKSIVEGEPCTLVIAGYADGEINTELTVIDFIYHKDKPIEVLHQQDGSN